MSSSAKHSNILSNLSHHAYLLIGNSQASESLLTLLEKEYGIETQGNPDFYVRNYETFTIDDSREIKALHNTRPVGGKQKNLNKKSDKKVDTLDFSEKKIFVLTMNGITVEAQNSLLKLLEEPAEYAHFFLIVPSAHLLLPTVKSRMTTIDGSRLKVQKTSDDDLRKEAEVFIKSNKTKRIDFIKKLVEDISKEKKTKQYAIDLLNVLEEIIYKEKGIKEEKLSLEAIEMARNYLNDRAPSVKMLMEYVALQI